jgi:hypothetical protein
MQNKTRQLLIEAIFDFAGDEFESKQDFIKLATKTDDELVEELINICKYFRDREN